MPDLLTYYAIGDILFTSFELLSLAECVKKEVIMVKVYKVTKTELFCEDYSVKINGKKAELNTARVSAHPLNRRWPGHQRGIEQSELVNFLSFAADEPIVIEIEPSQSFESFAVRPLESSAKAKREGEKIILNIDKAGYYTVEPYGRSRALHIFVDEQADFGIDKNDPNVIYFGEGEHDVGDIELKSGQTLFIDEGAVVYATVFANDAENIKILGHGILDNSKNKEEILFEVDGDNNDVDVGNAIRRHFISFDYCKNILIDGVTLRDSLVYNIRPAGCEDIVIRNVKLIGNWRYNSDGIDMHNCKNVLIDNCFIRTFDDSICAKGFGAWEDGEKMMLHNGKMHDVFCDLLVKNCVIWNDWGKCFEIGAECCADKMCDIKFCDSAIIHVNGAPLDCYNIDYADVHDIIYENISIEYDDVIPDSKIQKLDSQRYEDFDHDPDFVPRLISVIVGYHHEYSGGKTRRGRARRFTFKNIRLYGRQKIKLCARGYDAEHTSEDILIENLYRNGEKINDFDQTITEFNEFTKNIRIK